MSKDYLRVPIHEKTLITIDEASIYYNIGTARLRIFINENPFLAIPVGAKTLIKRRKMDEYLENNDVAL